MMKENHNLKHKTRIFKKNSLYLSKNKQKINKISIK